MKIDLSFLVVSFITGLSVDWIFQWSWEATNKSKWGSDDNKFKSLMALSCHAFIYALLTTVITLYLIGEMQSFSFVFMVLFISHAIIDTRIPVKYLMRFKGMTWGQINDFNNYGFMHRALDQRLHEAALLLLALILH